MLSAWNIWENAWLQLIEKTTSYQKQLKQPQLSCQFKWSLYEKWITSIEIRLCIRFLRQTPVGDWTSSDDVPEAWSLSPSDPIFKFSWTIS